LSASSVSGPHARSAGQARSQHFLAGRRLAAELAQAADLQAGDLVVEFGAGYGRLTVELASRAGRVVAVEIDERLASRLEARFETDEAVRVVHGDALEVPLPSRPFKVVSNPPFHVTSALLSRLLDDPRLPLVRADMIVGWGAALSLATVHPPSRRSLAWQPWYEVLLVRRLDGSSFQPAPRSPAAVISVRRRPSPLLAPAEAPAFRRWLRRAPLGQDVWQLVATYRGRR
jgi:23S rRNA (adenine-N6)-dimethyltransferase